MEASIINHTQNLDPDKQVNSRDQYGNQTFSTEKPQNKFIHHNHTFHLVLMHYVTTHSTLQQATDAHSQAHRHMHNTPQINPACLEAARHNNLGMFMYLRNQMEWDHSLSHVSCSLCQQRGDLAEGQNMQPQASLDTKWEARSTLKGHYMSKRKMVHRGSGDTAQREKRTRNTAGSWFLLPVQMILTFCIGTADWLCLHNFSNEHQDCWALSLTTTSILIKCIIPKTSDRIKVGLMAPHTLKDNKVLIISHAFISVCCLFLLWAVGI